MKRIDWYDRIFWGLVITAVILSIIGILYDVHAEDEDVTVCQTADGAFLFHIPASWNNPDLPSWWALGSYYQMMDETTIEVAPLTEVESYGEGFPQWEQDLRMGQALVGSGDYSQIVVAVSGESPCDANGYPVVITPEAPAEMPRNEPQAIASTGRTCIIQYPKIILVCS